MRAIVALIWLVGCGGAVEAGVTRVCLDGPTEDDTGWTESADWQLEGTFVAIEEGGEGGEYALQPCWNDPDHALVLTDDDGATWRVGFAVRDELETDRVPAVDLTAGDRVSVDFRAVQSFGSAAGVVVSDDDGVVFAVEDGSWGNALRETDVPGLAVSSGDAVAGDCDTCGRREKRELVFTGDDEVVLAPFEVGAVTVGGVQLTAIAVANLNWVGQMQCTDFAGYSAWAVFR